jgi:hypothetical protein
MGFQERLRASKRLRTNDPQGVDSAPLDIATSSGASRQGGGPQGRDDSLISEGNKLLEVCVCTHSMSCLISLIDQYVYTRSYVAR